MSFDDLHGQTVHIGADCGVQFASGRDLIMRVTYAEPGTYNPNDTAHLTGYVLGPDGDAVDRRTVYVMVAGLTVIDRRPARPPVRARNAGPAIPRPRTPSDITTTTTGRAR